jgi:putative tricarboxylic transport membrane protein
VSPESRRRDLPGILGSCLFIAIGAAALAFSGEFSPLGSVFPRTMAVAMILLSAVYIVVALARPRAPRAVQAGSPARRIALAVTLLAWALLLERVGFLVTGACAFAAILVIANYDRWTPLRAIAYVAASALLLGGLYAVFRFVLQVPFPQGMLL